MKKYKQYKKYKDCDLLWLNKIPEHWEILSFRNILVERNEKNSPIKSNERLSLSINKGVTLYADKTTNLDRFKDDFTKYKLAHEGDLVMNSMNMIVGAVGVSKYFGCVSPVYYTFTSDENHCNSTKYYEYLFKSKIVQGLLFSLGRGLIAKDRGDGKYNTLRLKVSRNDLLSLKLPNPSYLEQTQIASFLNYKIGKINRFIRKKKQLITLLNEQKAFIINQAVTEGLDSNAKMKDSNIERLGRIPLHWEVRRLKTVVSNKITDGPHETPVFVEHGIPFISAEAVNSDGTISFENRRADISKELDKIYSLKCKPQRDDVFIVKSGSTTGKIGYVDTDLDFNIWSPLALVRSKKEVISGEYTFRTLQSPYFQSQVQTRWSFGTQPNIGMGILENLYIIVPPKSEQRQILEYINKETSKILVAISTIEKEIALVEEYKTALIAETVTGKIDVGNFEIPEFEDTESYEDLTEELSLAEEGEIENRTEDIE